MMDVDLLWYVFFFKYSVYNGRIYIIEYVGKFK